MSQWRNQGQATLSRHLRDALDALGHRTFVLARPTRDNHVVPAFVDRADVWQQPDVAPATSHMIPEHEYLDWAREHSIEVAFFNQNYQFREIEALRRQGVRTVGYFVWEAFREKDVEPTRRAYDLVYSLNRCTRVRYRRLGIESPLLTWGIHPELLDVKPRPRSGGVHLFFPGGVQGPRKPIKKTIEAFRRTRHPDLRLVIKAQASGPFTEHVEVDDDPRITRITGDLAQGEYYDLFASCQVCLAPSRWEGTGLHLFEAAAFGMPMITNDIPPMNEFIRNGVNGRLVRSRCTGTAKSGIPKYDPDVDDLRAAIEELADPEVRERLSRGARAVCDALPWERTQEELAALLDSLAR
ncbi:MAG: glycosyltransferase family 4 protein [Myxococcota bacterium]